MKHGGGIRPYVWVLTFGPLCTFIEFRRKVLRHNVVKRVWSAEKVNCNDLLQVPISTIVLKHYADILQLK